MESSCECFQINSCEQPTRGGNPAFGLEVGFKHFILKWFVWQNVVQTKIIKLTLKNYVG
jgi:hypothetical protein